MISFIRGELVGFERDKVIVDVQGVGYGIFMPERSMGMLPRTGNEVKIHTYLNVKEDAMQLFGFLTREEVTLFKMLIGVSGIGPKGALGILSALSADDLRFAVLSGDAKAICAAPGIGKKTAEKLIIELKDKLDLEDILNHNQPDSAKLQGKAGENSISEIQSEAVQALVALGYGSTESMKAVKKAGDEYSSVEQLLKASLKNLF